MNRWRTAVTFLLFAIMFLGVTGCGGGSDDVMTCPLGRAVDPYIDNPYWKEQWYFHRDVTFYANNGIDENANIHPWPTQRYTGKGIKIVIIDTSLDTEHEDLCGGIAKTYNVLTKTEDVKPKVNDNIDVATHGTAVTGIAAATSNNKGISGIAPDAEIYFIRIPFDENSYVRYLVDAFEKAKEWGTDVVNCSWGTGDVDDSLKSAIRDLAIHGRNGKGTIIVFASGNGGDDGIGDDMGNDESAIPEVLGIGATNKFNRRTKYSNYGSELDLMAPGGEYIGLTTLDPTGTLGDSDGNYIHYNERYAFAGTSASAPVVTGIVAQILQAGANLTREQVFDLLERNADKIADADGSDCNYDANGHSDHCGYGKVNVTRTINDLLGRQP